MKIRTNTWRRVERLLLLAGTLLLSIYLGALLHGMIASRIALWRLNNTRKSGHAASGISAPADGEIDFTLWAKNRIQAYKESLASEFDQPLGELRISKLRLLVPIFEGTDDLTLNRGVGRIIGTATLGSGGNTGIAGHRDGFFRVLKDIKEGDSMEILTGDHTVSYNVRGIEIVNPNDSRVLKATVSPELTLVTCYPFYFVGSAPQRFIVHASLANANNNDDSAYLHSIQEPASN